MHTSPRTLPVDRLYLHKNEGPESEGGAAGLASYLDHIDGGYNRICDDKVTIVKANDDTVVWGEGGDNSRCLSLCIIGWSSETAAQYASDPYSHAEFERAAQQCASWCRTYHVPAVHVRPGAPGHAPTDRGIAEHADDHDPASQGHTDPGPAFPIAAFVARVAALVAPINWHDIELLFEWQQRVSKTALHQGERSKDVQTMNELLALKGYEIVTPGFAYGDDSVRAVTVLKTFKRLPNHDGTHFGKYAAPAIFK